MAAQTTDLFRAKRGVAILAACIVQTLNESDPTFQRRFLERNAAAYRLLKDNDLFEGDLTEEMALLAWTREFLTGFDFINGQREPLLAKYKPGDINH